MRPPPAASARGTRASGSLTSACGRAGASDLESPQRLLQPLAYVGQVLARRGHARHRRGLLLHDGAHLLGARRIHLGRRRERFDLLRQRLRLAALLVGRTDDAVDGRARRGDLAIDLRQRLGGGANDGLAGRDAIARLDDLLLRADGARADLGGELANLVQCPGALRRELAHFVGHHRETLAMLASASSAATVPRRVVRCAMSAALRACSALLATMTARVATRLDASEAFTTPLVCVAAAWAIAPAALDTSCVDAVICCALDARLSAVLATSAADASSSAINARNPEVILRKEPASVPSSSSDSKASSCRSSPRDTRSAWRDRRATPRVKCAALKKASPIARASARAQ